MRSMGLLLVALICLPIIGFAEDDAEDTSLAETLDNTIGLLRKYSLSFDPDEAKRAAVQALVKEADPRGQMLTLDEAEHLLNTQRGSVLQVGIRIVQSNEQVVIVDVLKDTAAEEAGLMVGEVIKRIDKGDISELSIIEVNQLLRGPVEETVRLKVLDTNNTPRKLDVERDAIQLDAIEVAEELPTGIGYLKLNGVYERSGKDIISTLRGWVGSDHPGVILDLRGAGGTDLESAGDIASLFTEPESLLYAYRDAQDQELLVCKSRPGVFFNSPLMALIDGETTGAAELLAAVLTGSTHGVMLLGDPSRGDPLVREFVDLPGDRKLYIVTRRLVTEDGTVYNGQEGIRPDLLSAQIIIGEYEPELDEREKDELNDEELEDWELRKRVRGDSILRRAADLILGLKALNIGAFSGDQNPTN